MLKSVHTVHAHTEIANRGMLNTLYSVRVGVITILGRAHVNSYLQKQLCWKVQAQAD